MHIITPTNQTHQTTFNTTTRDKHDSMHVIPHPKTIQKKKNKSTDPSSHNKPFPIESIRKAPKLARKAQIGKLNHQKKKRSHLSEKRRYRIPPRGSGTAGEGDRGPNNGGHGRQIRRRRRRRRRRRVWNRKEGLVGFYIRHLGLAHRTYRNLTQVSYFLL